MNTETLSWKDGDIYRWSWNEHEYEQRKNLANLYWCESRIGVVNGEYLVDTFWSGGSQSRHFHKDTVISKLNVEFIGNKGDFSPCRKEDRAMYDDKDFLDLSHANNSGEYYLKKGAVKSKEKMIKVVKRNALYLKRKIESAQRDLEIHLEKLTNVDDLNYVYGLSDVSLYDESYVDEEFHLLGI